VQGLIEEGHSNSIDTNQICDAMTGTCGEDISRLAAVGLYCEDEGDGGDVVDADDTVTESVVSTEEADNVIAGIAELEELGEMMRISNIF
jgi:hypothetical protein